MTHGSGMQAQAASLRRITQGGLNEASAVGAAGLDSSLGEAGRREREVVSTVEIVRHPSEAEQILRLLPGQLRGLKALRPRAGPPSLPPAVRLRSCGHSVLSTEANTVSRRERTMHQDRGWSPPPAEPCALR